MNYVSEDTLNNIFDRHTNVYAIISNLNVVKDNKKSFGKVVYLVNLKNKKKISVNDIVEFNADKIKWTSSIFDDDGCTLHLINPYWCKLFTNNPKIKVPVKILLSKVIEDKRIYFNEVEYQIMNRDQYRKRRLLEIFSAVQYRILMAVENLGRRWYETNDYYKALNETSKNYNIKHDMLKEYYGKYNNCKKIINKEWNNLLIKHYQRHLAENQIEKYFKKFKENNKSSNVLEFKNRLV